MEDSIHACLTRMVNDVIDHPFLVDSSPCVDLTIKELLDCYPSDLKVKIGYVQDTCAHVFIDEKERYSNDIPHLLKTDIFSVDLSTYALSTEKGIIHFA